ncbi:GNAT family N-acetyltransferase [Silvimonas iriomotensis]|uniref:ElaA protein n=1 Tax=Silvimonas iriomotensis TaxID=449662 RepID=A0ABQ2PE91_9NEIS|nr:GNAT family N-acetyltransferase [Silvimonas iriomotensis]GGP23717.1 ElaA protein [Silvimonas iriomotensis]
MTTDIQWHWFQFADFDPATFYAYLKLRQDVFVIEQTCIYPDLDDLDQPSWHLVGRREGRVVAALRIVPPGLKYAEPSIGRVVVAAEARKGGMGKLLVAEGLRQSAALWPGQGNRIGAQAHLQKMYGALGFVTVGQQYDEDGIPHVDMLWQQPA